MHTTNSLMHLAYSHALNEQGTQLNLLTPVFHIKDNPYLPCSAAKFHNIPYRCSCTPQFLHTGKTDHICHADYTNYIAATHNMTHSPSTSTCTTHPALPTPMPSTTLLCTQLTNTKYLCKWQQNGTRCRDRVKVLGTSLVGF